MSVTYALMDLSPSGWHLFNYAILWFGLLTAIWTRRKSTLRLDRSSWALAVGALAAAFVFS